MRIGSLYLSIASILALLALTATATSQAPVPLRDAEQARRVTAVVERFFHLSSRGGGFPKDSIEVYTTGPLAESIEKMGERSFWPSLPAYRIGNPMSIRPNDSLVIVHATTPADSLPMVGQLIIDWVFFLALQEEGNWRIGEVRRMVSTDGAIETIRAVAASGAYPERLKPQIIREHGAALLNNAELRREFENQRPVFNALADGLRGLDSLALIGRTGDKISQLNYTSFDWGYATEDVPQEIIDEYLATAEPDEKFEIEERMKAARKQLEEGRKTLARMANELKVPLAAIDSTVLRMRQARIVFINTDLPWKDAILFTVGGQMDEAVGYLYSPNGEVPWISPEEYYYLEELGDGWWIYRAT